MKPDEILSEHNIVQCSMSDSCPSTSVRRQLEFGTKRQIVDIPTLFSTKSDGWDLGGFHLHLFPFHFIFLVHFTITFKSSKFNSSSIECSISHDNIISFEQWYNVISLLVISLFLKGEKWLLLKYCKMIWNEYSSRIPKF